MRFNLRFRIAAGAALLAGVCLTVSGCGSGMGGVAQPITPVLPAVSVSGVAHGGQQPISGATVQLWAAGTIGDASSATPLLTSTVTTDANGKFTITGKYTCPTPGSLVYVTVNGGNPGLASGTNNSAIQLMTAIGACSTLKSTTFIAVDEVTTVAMVAALGEPAPTQIYAYSNVGYDATNSLFPNDTTNFANAMTLATEYANSTTGTSPGVNVPAGMTVPVAQINTLANILSACVNSTGGVAGDGSPCGNLFSYATTTSLWVPANTIRTLLDLWLAPARNVSQIFGLSSAIAPFQPALSAPPPTWSVAMSATSPTLTLSPGTVGFSPTTIGQTAGAQSVMVTNTSASAVAVTISAAGVNSWEFPESDNCGGTVGANGSCTATVSFAPTAAGVQYGDLAVQTSSGTQYAALTGTGVQGATPAPQGALTFEQTSLTIPSPVATSNNGFVRITNFTNSAITLLPPFTFTGTNAADFAVVNTAGNTLAEPCGTTLAVGASCRLIISFRPSLAVNKTETAMLNVTSGAGAGTVTQVPLTGMVTPGVDVTQLSGCSLADESGCEAAIQTAINNALTYYNGCYGGTGTGGNYTIVIPAGVFDLSRQTLPVGNSGFFTLDGLYACNGTFTFAGAGAALTTIITNNTSGNFHGTKISNTTIEGMSLRRSDTNSMDGMSQTAARFVSRTTGNNGKGPDTLTVDILPGFPSIADVLAAYSNTSNWIKAYDDSNISDPVMDPQQDNAQHSFDPTTVSCAPVGGVTQCTFTLGNREMITPQVYSNPNNIVCFKMETQGTYFLSDAGGLTTGNNVGFNDVYWYDSGRGALRNIHHIFVTYSALKRRPSIPAMNGQAPCFASWAGGPQIGQPNDPLLTGIVLDHFMSEGAADQTTEIFFEDPNEPAGGSVVSNYTVHGGFGGPFTFDNACGMTMDWSSGPHGVPLNQTMQNCSWTTDSTTPALKNPLLNGMPAYNGCVAYYGTTVGCPTQNDLFPNFNQ